MTARGALSPALAFAVAAAGIGLFSVMDAFMKSLTLALGVYNALLWRTALSAGLGGAGWMLSGGGWPSRRATRLHLARGTVTTGMALLFFWGLARVPMALTYIAPLLALLLGAVFLGERVGARVIDASIAALVGVGVILLGQARMTLGPEALANGSLFLLGWAYAHGEAGYLATTECTSFVYAGVLGWAVFGEHVAPTTLAGAGVIVAACLIAARRRDVARAPLEGAA